MTHEQAISVLRKVFLAGYNGEVRCISGEYAVIVHGDTCDYFIWTEQDLDSEWPEYIDSYPRSSIRPRVSIRKIGKTGTRIIYDIPLGNGTE